MSTCTCWNAFSGTGILVTGALVCLWILDLWHGTHCLHQRAMSLFMWCQTKSLQISCFVVRGPGWAKPWRISNTSFCRLGGTSGRGWPQGGVAKDLVSVDGYVLQPHAGDGCSGIVSVLVILLCLVHDARADALINALHVLVGKGICDHILLAFLVENLVEHFCYCGEVALLPG